VLTITASFKTDWNAFCYKGQVFWLKAVFKPMKPVFNWVENNYKGFIFGWNIFLE